MQKGNDVARTVHIGKLYHSTIKLVGKLSLSGISSKLMLSTLVYCSLFIPGANFGGIGLFLWQLQSGIPILLKVWEKTSWP